MQNGKRIFFLSLFSLSLQLRVYLLSGRKRWYVRGEVQPFCNLFFSERLILLKDYLLARFNSKQFHQPDRRNFLKMRLYVRPCVAVVVAQLEISPSYYIYYTIYIHSQQQLKFLNHFVVQSARK